MQSQALKKSVGIQTMYRSSEAQTDPYSADYFTDPSEEPPEVPSLFISYFWPLSATATQN